MISGASYNGSNDDGAEVTALRSSGYNISAAGREEKMLWHRWDTFSAAEKDFRSESEACCTLPERYTEGAQTDFVLVNEATLSDTGRSPMAGT
ncbi:hypothetical protein H9Q72_011647 [Fusarium xylarioides]|uniref:Uncharacterized protein n=1 Tax=Fusarium xylarioides TaxID=221167 RepID=A0A9P7IWQ6_9HYPO|nr:hypothetical protein H9Q72_011647 [Fusarium xylarioides]KAG5814684.1 hypothetical protein H9Q71_003108 [Fusarium xylarioides]KAG5827228.1 hypothetical protein H9Q74_002695 [Fusarium xylarioides]